MCERSVQIKNLNSMVARIRNEYVSGSGDIDPDRAFKLTFAFAADAESELPFTFAVKHNHPVVNAVDQIDPSVRADGQIAGLIGAGLNLQ